MKPRPPDNQVLEEAGQDLGVLGTSAAGAQGLCSSVYCTTPVYFLLVTVIASLSSLYLTSFGQGPRFVQSLVSSGLSRNTERKEEAGI